MAFSIGREQTTFGNKKVVLLSCSVDATSGNIDTGLSIVDAFSICPISMATQTNGIPLFKKNVGSGATSRNGMINCNALTSGDVFFLVVYGR